MVTLKDYSREGEKPQYYLTTEHEERFAYSDFNDLTNDIEIYKNGGVKTRHGSLSEFILENKKGEIVKAYKIIPWQTPNKYENTKGNEEVRRRIEKGVRRFSNQ